MRKTKKMAPMDEMPDDPGMDMMMNPLRKKKRTKMRAPVMKVKPAKRRK